MSWQAYTRRNTAVRKAFAEHGLSAREADFGGGYEGSHVPLESGYGLEVSQDYDAGGGMPWSVRVTHGNDNLTGIDRGQPADIELGVLHPRAVPDAIKAHMGSGGRITNVIRQHMATNTVNRRQFG